MATKEKELDDLFDEKEDEVTQVYEPLVHTMIRTISRTGMVDGGSYPLAWVDQQTSEWVAKGYKLINAQYIGTMPEGIQVLYVFAKQ